MALAVSFAATSSAFSAPISTGPVATPSGFYQVSGKARNGRSGYEGILETPLATDPTLNPPGVPAWGFGLNHGFELLYDFATGSSKWSIDFNMDGDFLDSQESATAINISMIGQSFKYANIFLQGSSTSTASVSDFSINGTNFGPFGPAGNTAFEQFFTDTNGMFGNINISGKLNFSANGGNDERPRLWVRLGEQSAVIPVPAALPLLVGALSILGLLGWRRKSPVAA